MLAHCLLGQLGVLRLESRDQFGMPKHRGVLCRARSPVHPPKPEIVAKQDIRSVLQPRVADHVHEKCMDRMVITEVRLVVSSLTREVRGLNQAAQRNQVGFGRAFGDDVRNTALDGLSRFEHVDHILEGHRRDHRATTREDGDKFIGHQPGERLAHRHPTQPELTGQRLLVHYRTRQKAQVEDPITQSVVCDVAGPWPSVSHGHLRTDRVTCVDGDESITGQR